MGFFGLINHLVSFVICLVCKSLGRRKDLGDSPNGLIQLFPIMRFGKTLASPANADRFEEDTEPGGGNSK